MYPYYKRVNIFENKCILFCKLCVFKKGKGKEVKANATTILNFITGPKHVAVTMYTCARLNMANNKKLER